MIFSKTLFDCDHDNNSILVMLMLLVSPFLMNRVQSPTFARFSKVDVCCFTLFLRFFPHVLPGLTTSDGLRMHLFSKTKRVQCHLGFSWSNWSLGSLKPCWLIQYSFQHLQHGHYLPQKLPQDSSHPSLELPAFDSSFTHFPDWKEEWEPLKNDSIQHFLRELLKWIEMYPSIPPLFKPISLNYT